MTQIAFVAYPGFTALDMIGPYEVLRNLPGAQVRFVWHEAGPITADSGVLVIGATHTLAETPSPDVILVPGGPSTPVHARDDALLDWLRRAHQTASWTASVCSGSVILAAAGLLDGRRATSHWLTIPALKAFGAIPVADERIVHSDDIVTSAGVSAGLDLALWLAGQIGGENRAKAIQPRARIRPAAAVRLGPHVEGVCDHEGRGDGAAVQGQREARQRQGHDVAGLGAGAG